MPKGRAADVLTRITRSDRRALENLAKLAGAPAEAVAAALIETSLRAFRAEHHALDGTSARALAEPAARIGWR